MSLVLQDQSLINGVANAIQLGQDGQLAQFIPPTDQSVTIVINATGITGTALVIQGSPDISASVASPTWSGTSAYNQTGNAWVNYNASGFTGYDNAITTFQVPCSNFKSLRIWQNGTLTGGSPTVTLKSSQNPVPTQVVITSVLTAPFAITGANVAAFSVANTGTNYAFQVNTNTASSVTGLEIIANTAGSGVELQTISSGTNEALNIDAKAAAAIVLAGQASTATGVQIGSSTSAANIVCTVYSSSTTAFQVGPNGATNPSFLVNSNAGTAATGLKLTAAAAGSGFAVQVITSGTNEALTIDAAAAALITLAGAAASATGVQVGSSTSAANAKLTVYSSNAAAFAVGPNGGTNPTLTVNANTASAKTGLSVTAAAAGSNVALAATSNATNEGLTLDGKGSGIVIIGSVSTGGANIRLAVSTVAATGNTISNAAALLEGYTTVTGANNSAAVKLPVGAIGMQCIVQNTVQTATLQVFPQVNAAINNLSANSVYNIANGAVRTFVYTASNQWYAEPQTVT